MKNYQKILKKLEEIVKSSSYELFPLVFVEKNGCDMFSDEKIEDLEGYNAQIDLVKKNRFGRVIERGDSIQFNGVTELEVVEKINNYIDINFPSKKGKITIFTGIDDLED